MIFLRVLVLAAAIALATMQFGWITVPVLGAIYAVLLRRVSAPGEAALAALLGWGALMARVATVPAFSTMLPQLGGIFGAPGAVVAIVSVLFAVGLAWSAAKVVSAVAARGPEAN